MITMLNLKQLFWGQITLFCVCAHNKKYKPEYIILKCPLALSVYTLSSAWKCDKIA